MQRSRLLPPLAVLALVAAAPRHAGAQATPEIRRKQDERPVIARVLGAPVIPGTIATSPVTFAVPRGAKTARFTVTPMSGVRLFSDTAGEMSLDGDSVLLPVTYSVARTQKSGAATIARVSVLFSDATVLAADLVADVRARRALRLALASENGGVAHRNRTARLRLTLANHGNAADTVTLRWSAGADWQLLRAPTLVIVPAGETLVQAVELRCPGTAAIGQVHIAQVSATGSGTSPSASVALRVTYEPSASAGFVEAPTTVFMGTTIDEAGNVQRAAGLSSSGSLDHRTDFDLIVRRRATMIDPVFAEELGGQSFRLGVRRGDLVTAVGDVWQPGGALTGVIAQGRGIGASWNGDSLRASALFAFPSPGIHQRVASVGGSMATRWGWFGATATSLERMTSLAGDTTRVHSAGLRFSRGDHGSQFVAAELGVLRLEGTGGQSTTGLGFDGTLAHTDDVNAVSARLHLVPASPASRELMPTNFFVSGSRAVHERVRVLATGSATRLMMPDGRLTARGFSGGASFVLGSANLTMLGTLRSLHASGTQSWSSHGEGATLAVAAPLWRVTLDGYAERGAITTRDTVGWSDVLRGGVRWAGAQGWLWAGLAYSRGETGSLQRTTELGGAYRRGRAEVQGGTNAMIEAQPFVRQDTRALDVRDALQVATFWSRISYDVRSDLSLVAGSAYQSHAPASPWRFSLGLRQRVNVPLPVHRAPVAQGVVYEDRDGDRTRGAGEPGVAGATVRLGPDQVTTGADGAFAFLDPGTRGHALSLDAASLPSGYLIPPDARNAREGRVDMPVVRSASLRLILFADANGDSLRDDDAALPDGVIVSATDAAGRTIEGMVGPDGIATFGALLPGTYEIRVIVAPSGPRGPIMRSTRVELAPGATIRREIPVPASQRAVRFRSGPTD